MPASKRASRGRGVGIRVPQSRSRWGCFECKSRRVKCSEEREKCSSCKDLDVECVYPVRPTTSQATNGEAQLSHPWAMITASEHRPSSTPLQWTLPLSEGDDNAGAFSSLLSLDQIPSILTGEAAVPQRMLTTIRAETMDQPPGGNEVENSRSDETASTSATTSSLQPAAFSTETLASTEAAMDQTVSLTTGTKATKDAPFSSQSLNGQDWPGTSTVPNCLRFFQPFISALGLGKNDRVRSILFEPRHWELLRMFEYDTNRSLVTRHEQSSSLTILVRSNLSKIQNDSPSIAGVLHAILCAAAVHRSNLENSTSSPRNAGYSASFNPHGQSSVRWHSGSLEAQHHRQKALSMMKIAVEQQEMTEQAKLTASMRWNQYLIQSISIILLIAASIIEGDPYMLPVLLQTYTAGVAPACEPPTPLLRLQKDVIEHLFAIYDILWCLTNRKAAGTINRNIIISERQSSGYGPIQDVESSVAFRRDLSHIFGVGFAMWKTLGTVCNLVLRYRTTRDSANQSPASQSATLALSEVVAEASGLLYHLCERWGNDETVLCRAGEPMRIQLGNEMFRHACIIYLLKAVFSARSRDSRIRASVRAIVEYVAEVPLCAQVGVNWPLVVAGAEARDEKHRATVRSLLQVSVSNGQKMYGVCLAVLGPLWEARDAGDESLCWSEVTAELGGPIII